MSSSTGSRNALIALACCTALASFAAAPAHSKSTASIQRTEDNLAAAGFIVKPANTPERADMLMRLPANKFVQRVEGDDVTYVYADPKACGCLYVGTQEAYGQYRKAMQAKNLLDQQQDNFETYRDAAWDWGAWGPWGGGWRFGYGW